MSTSVNTSLSGLTSIQQQLTDLKARTVSTLLSTAQTSISSLTETICSGYEDQCTFSFIAKSLNAISSAAESSGISDVMGNVTSFALLLQEEGYDTVSIMEYLGQVESLASSDPDTLVEIFSSSDASTTSQITSEIESTEAETGDDTFEA